MFFELFCCDVFYFCEIKKSEGLKNAGVVPKLEGLVL